MNPAQKNAIELLLWVIYAFALTITLVYANMPMWENIIFLLLIIWCVDKINQKWGNI